jgi:hypothetical protein
MKFKIKFITNSDRAKTAYVEASTFGQAVTQAEDTANEYGEGFKCIKGAVKVGEPFEGTMVALEKQLKAHEATIADYKKALSIMLENTEHRTKELIDLEGEYELTKQNFTDYVEDKQAEIAELQEENKWISVKDRLPEVEGEYLVFVQVPPPRAHSNAERVMITKWFFTTGFVATQHKFITHWKPITQPTV